MKVSEVIASVDCRSTDNSARFEGIQGEVSGELFGIENMLQYEVSSQKFTLPSQFPRQDGSILMKLREKYQATGFSECEREEQLNLGAGAEGKEDDSDLAFPPTPTPVSSRPSLISITEDHAVNILSQLSRDRS